MDEMNETGAMVGHEQAESFTCPGCGGTMVFDISSQRIRCERCDNLADLAEPAVIQEYALRREGGGMDQVWQEQMSLVRCESCGSEIVVSQEALVARCEYCGSEKVLVARAQAGIPPEAIIPFAVDRRGAGAAFRKWVSRRFWAPGSLKKAFYEDKIEAVYLPYWTFDAQADAWYSAQGGRVYYVTEGFGEKRRRVRRVNWYPVRGSISRFFDDVLVSARRVRDRVIARIESFGTHQLVPFNSAYLSGFKAEKYNTTPQEGFEEARKEMLSALREQARKEVLRYYDEVRSVNLQANFSRMTFKHILVPFWMSSYWYMNKPYRFAVNAQTGRVHGETPVSKTKVALAILIGLAALILALVYYLNNPTG